MVRGQSLVELGRREGFVEFGAEASSSTSSSAGIRDFSAGQRRIAERVGFRGDLAVIDQSFFTLTYGGAIHLSQDAVSGDQLSDQGAGRLFNYNLEGNFFPAKPYWLTVFANRSSSTNLRDFAGTSEVVNSNEGAALNLKSLPLPSTISYRQEASDENSAFADLFTERRERRKLATYDGNNHWKAQDVGLHYEWAEIQDVLIPALGFRTHTAGATHRFRFGSYLPNSLNFNLNYVRRIDGQQLSSSALTAIEDLALQHSKSFSTGYHYVLSRFTGVGGDTTAHSGAVSLQHRLYESLRTDLTLQTTHSSLAEGMQQVYGGRLNLDYRKKLSAKGTLLASFNTRYDVENDRIPGKTIPVFRERHTAHIGIPFRLNQPRVIETTISVNADDNTIIFVEGLDYTVRAVDSFVEIEVLLTGRVHEGEVLAVDYEVVAPPLIRFSTFSDMFSVGPDFGWLYPYYIYERNRQGLLSGIDTGFLENLRAHTAGVRFRWNTSRISVLLLNEYRTQESPILPYNSLQFSQVFSYTARESLILGVTLDEILADYQKPERKTQNGLGRMSIAWSPRQSLTVDSFWSMRLWRDTLSVNENFSQGGMRLRWSPSKFTAAVTWDRNVRSRGPIEAHEFRWFTSVVRRF
jgi:hypothetical protein